MGASNLAPGSSSNRHSATTPSRSPVKSTFPRSQTLAALTTFYTGVSADGNLVEEDGGHAGEVAQVENHETAIDVPANDQSVDSRGENAVRALDEDRRRLLGEEQRVYSRDVPRF